MYIKQIYTACLAQASYYIESEGVAAVVDPIRDVDIYLELARRRQARIKYVFLTHFHADFVAGHIDLASKAGSLIVLGPSSHPGYRALISYDGELFSIGKIKIKVLSTPGHTLESCCFLVMDEEGKMNSVFTGDTLFVGDVGRPDLLSGNLGSEQLASMLFDSLENRIKTLPDDVVVYPGHGAGSACGRNLGKETVSTIGAEKQNNYALREITREEFVKLVTADQPLAPPYFFKDALINVNGYQHLDKVLRKNLVPLHAVDFKSLVSDGVLVLDTRSPKDFAEGFIPGSINIGLDGQFAIWAGTLIDFDRPIVLVTDPGREREAVVRLARIGYENVPGYLEGGMEAMKVRGEKLDRIPALSIDEVPAGAVLLDVRKRTETGKERLVDAIAIPLDELFSKMNMLDKNISYAVCCQSGYRSMIAASILLKSGFKNIFNINGGVNALRQSHPSLLIIAP